MSRFLISILILLISTPFWADITLKEAVRKGMKISNQLKSLSNSEQAQYIRTVNAKMNRLFKINGSASYLYKSSRPSSPLPEGKSIGTHHTYDLNVQINQSILDGGILNKKYAQSKLFKNQLSNSIQNTRILISGAIIGSYLNYKFLLKQKEIQNALLKNLLLHEKKINNLYKEDLIIKTDLIETEQIKVSKINSIDEINELIQIETLEFQKLCGYSPANIDSWALSNKITLRECINYFENRHPSVKKIKIDISSETINGEISQSIYKPHLTGYAAIHYGKPGVDFFNNKWKVYAEGGLNLKLNLFDWNKKNRERKITQYNIEKLKYEKNEIFWETSKELKQLFKTRQHINYRLKNLNKIIKLSKEECILKKALYQEHQITNIEYLRALTTKEKHMAQQQTLKCTYEITKLKILITSGLILEKI